MFEGEKIVANHLFNQETNVLCKWPSLSQISKLCAPEMLLNNTKVESSVCNRVYVCACCSVGPPQSYCCDSYHPGQEQIACQNKHSHFRPMGRQLSERMQLGCIFFLSTVECLQIRFLFWEGGSQGSEKPCKRITVVLWCVRHSLSVTWEEVKTSRTACIINSCEKVLTFCVFHG